MHGSTRRLGRGARLAIAAGGTALSMLSCFASGASAARSELPTGAFSVTLQVVVPGSPDESFDAFTGDVTAWWDHHFSDHPRRIVLEPRVGGRFFEEWSDEGEGALYATVTLVDRGKRLRFTGPMGLMGNGLWMDHTLDFSDRGDSTLVALTLTGAGQLQPGWPAAVESTWRHFLVERFKPFVEGRLP